MNKLFIRTLIAVCALANTSFALERLTIVGKEIQHNGTSIHLQGMNVLAEMNKLEEADVQIMADMGVNFVRLLIDVDVPFDPNDTEGDGDYLDSGQLNEWKTITDWFTQRQIWVHVELRWNNEDLSTSDIWVPSSALHTKYIAMWSGIVNALKGYDYIASWGLLAEHAQGSRSIVKEAFEPVMQAIDALDSTNTPFCFGPKLNSIDYYDTANYTDWYWPEYANRIIYQINHLHPKPYIANRPDLGYDPATWWYHRTDGQDPGPPANDADGSMNKAGNLAHLQPGIDWRDFYNAPIYIDQWGCSADQPGYMDYERDLLEIFKEQGFLHHTRWIWTQPGNFRGVKESPALLDFWAMALAEDYILPHVVAYSDYNAQDNHITTEASSANLPWNIDFQFSAPFACNRIELWNGNTAAVNDPATVDVYGSNNGSNWNHLTTIDGIVFTNRLALYTSPSFVNTNAYLVYRLTVTANNGGSQTALSNLEFFPGSKGIAPMTSTSAVSVVADTYAYSSSGTVNSNYGGASVIQLRKDSGAGPEGGGVSRVGYLKFDVNSPTTPIVGATLHIYANTASNMVNALAVSDTAWLENELTWSNRPPTGAVIGSGQAAAATWFSIDVSGYVVSNGTYSIALDEQGNEKQTVGTKEGGHGAYLEVVNIVGVSDPYADWLAEYPGLGSNTNKTDNPDGDALNNLYEYALGGNPMIPDTGNASAFQLGASYLEYIHAQRDDAAERGLTYQVETKTNLVSGADWSQDTVEVVGTNTNFGVAGFDAVTNRVPTAVEAQQFIRLKVEM